MPSHKFFHFQNASIQSLCRMGFALDPTAEAISTPNPYKPPSWFYGISRLDGDGRRGKWEGRAEKVESSRGEGSR